LRISHARRGDQCHQYHDELNQEKHWNHLMQGAHSALPTIGRGAFNFAARSGLLRRSHVISTGAQNFMNIS
jgi:hypothetical protein